MSQAAHQRSVGVEVNPNFIQAGDCAAPLSQFYPNRLLNCLLVRVKLAE